MGSFEAASDDVRGRKQGGTVGVSTERVACVDLPAFPLQLLLRRHPDWRDLPVAVVEHDRPQGLVLWVNEHARARRILPGMRHAAALALSRDLRAAEVSNAWVDLAIARVTRRLRYFSPHVEPSHDEPGVFWLDASGLERLYDSLLDWATGIRDDLTEAGLESSVVVGFGRFGSYALARARRRLSVLASSRDERSAARRVPLDRLGLEPKHRDALARLGVRSLGEWVDLPADGLTARFGEELYRLHRIAAGALQDPLQPEPEVAPPADRRLLDYAETTVPPLMCVIEELLDQVRATLIERRQSAAALRLQLRFESGGEHVEIVRPAAPTLDRRQLLDLIRLRLGSLRLSDGVSELQLTARGESCEQRQLDLFDERPRRDLDAANRALARVRAELGDAAVVRAELREGHLPEGRFRWERLKSLQVAAPREVETICMVRRLFDRPLPLPPRPRQEPDGWMLRGITDGPVDRVMGPYLLSGGWWRRAVQREYLFAETRAGELLWVYYDRFRRRWFQQGRVE